MTTKRVKEMYERAMLAKVPICAWKFNAAQDVIKHNRNASLYMQRAMILEKTFREIPIFIEEGDLVCGSGASKPYGVEINYEFGMWPEQELADLQKESGLFYIEDDDLALCRDFYASGWAKETVNQNILLADIYCNDERLWNCISAGVQLPTWPSREFALFSNVIGQTGYGLGPGFLLMAPDYNMILSRGARSIIDECKEHLKNLNYTERASFRKKDYWEGVIRVFEAFIAFANRYADLAEKMAAEETDEKRKAELLEMARINRRVPEYPCSSFREALQVYWYTWLTTTSPTNAAGRVDQYLYPYYKASIEKGEITDAEVLELLEIMRIKFNKCTVMAGNNYRSANSGEARWYNHMLGGVDRDGNDATNELSHLFLQAAEEVRTPHPTLTVRVHEKTPKEFLRRALQVVRLGMGLPAFVSDDVYIRFFVEHGVSLEDAREYVCTGCLDGNIPGLTRIQAFKFIVVPAIFDIFLHNGYSRFSHHMAGIETGDVTQMQTFEEFRAAFKKQLDYLIHCEADINNCEMYYQAEYYGDPFRSALFKDGISSGTEMLQRKIEPFENGSALSETGAINTADSMTAIKKLIFEEKKYTMQQLLTALDANWEGYEEMRQDFVKAPKYGNNIDEADQMAADVMAMYADACWKCDHLYGGKVLPAGISISAHQPGGMQTGASPDGRFAGEILADGAISPEHGCDTCGFLAVLQSGLKINQGEYNATLLNSKFHPSALKSDEDLDKLAGVIRTYLANGGRHIQFNVVSREVLEEAKERPQEHRDVIVRVAGYSTYFTQLTPMMQDEIIERTTFETV